MKLIKRIAGFFTARRARPDANGRVSALREEVARSDRELEAHRRRLERHQDKIDKAMVAMQKEILAAKQAMQRAEGLNKQLVLALDAKEQELYTANEIVIPGLVQANQTFKEAWAAESAAHVMRQIALTPDKAPAG